VSSAKTGLWSALGALAGGFVGAKAGYYAATTRPRVRYAAQRGGNVEDAMVVGGATGAVIGAFVGGALSGESPAPQQPPQLPR
jgi:hypothetical protein